MVSDECDWRVDPDPVDGFKLRGKGPGCRVQADKVLENLGPMAKKVFNRRLEIIDDLPTKSEG
jgi:hypothetical protein